MKLANPVRVRVSKAAVLELLVFAGAALTAVGVGMIYLPAGAIVGGLLVAACAYLELRTTSPTTPAAPTARGRRQ